MSAAQNLTADDLDLIRLFPDAGIHPAHLRYQGADGTARRVERVMIALGLPQAVWKDGQIVVPASYAKRREELRQSENAGTKSVRVQSGRFPNHPRCPLRDAGKVLFWERGYNASWDMMQREARL